VGKTVGVVMKPEECVRSIVVLFVAFCAGYFGIVPKNEQGIYMKLKEFAITLTLAVATALLLALILYGGTCNG